MGICIEIPEFITHVMLTKGKVGGKPPTFAKINYQSIYNGKYQRHTRALIMDSIHKFIESYLIGYKNTLSTAIISDLDPLLPYKITLTIHCNKDLCKVRMFNGKLSYNLSDKKYIPKWDLDNLGFIWIKAFQDVATQNRLIEDDSIEFIQNLSINWIECKYEDRKLIFEINNV